MQSKTIKTPIFLLGLSLPLSILLSNYLFIVAALVLLFNSPKRKNIRWLALFVLLIPALIPILSIFFHNESFSLNSVEVKIPFIAVALLVGFTKLNDTLLSKFKYGFIYGTLTGALLSVIGETKLVYFLQSYLFFEFTYISLYSVISLVFLWFTDIKIKKVFKIIFSFVFILVLIFLGKTFFIITGVLATFAAIIIKGSPLQSKLVIGFLVFIFSLFLYKGVEIQQYLETSSQEEINGVDKLAQWQCVLEVMQDKELFGVGYSSKEELLTTCYHEHGMFKAEANTLNSHNEYLDAFLTLGYIGLLSMLIYFLKIMFVAYDTKQVAHLLVIILIALFSITENVFTRQKGVMITSITILLIFSSKKKEDVSIEGNTSITQDHK